MSKESNFSWSDDDTIVIQRVDAVAVYTNPSDQIVIRQESAMQDEDVFIVIPRDRIDALIAALEREAARGT